MGSGEWTDPGQEILIRPGCFCRLELPGEHTVFSDIRGFGSTAGAAFSHLFPLRMGRNLLCFQLTSADDVTGVVTAGNITDAVHEVANS